MKPRERSMKWFMLILIVTTNCTKGEYVTDVDTLTLNYEFDEKPEIHSEHVKDHLKTSELRSSKDRLILPKISRYDERDERSNVNKLKTSRRMLPERYSNIDMRRNYSTREIREVYLEMPRLRMDSSRTAGLERSLKNMNNHRNGFSKQQRKVRIYGYTTVMPDATNNARQLSENRSRDRFYVTRQHYRDNFKQGDKVSEMRYLTPVIEVRTFRQNSISASNKDQKSQERRNRVEQNNSNRRFIRMENVRKQNDRQQINRNRFERIRANSRDNIIASEERSALTNKFIPKTLSNIVAEKQLVTQEILEITDNRQISLNRQKRNTVRQADRIQNTREILHDTDSQKFRKFNKNDKRIAEVRHRDGITRERINVNIDSRQRTTEDRYRDGASRERMNVDINSRQRSAEGRYQDSITRDRININTHPKQRISEDHHRDSITRERINGNTKSMEITTKDRLRTDSTRERINTNIYSKQRTAEDRYRDDTSRERMNVNINSRQRSAEGRYQDKTTRDRININVHSRQRIAEDHHRDSITRERMNGNTNSRERTAKDQLRTDSTRERINANIHSRQRTAEDRYRNNTSRERMNVNINSRQRSAEGRYQDSITRDRININTHSKQKITEDNHRDSITRERIDGNIISRERTAKDRLRTDSTRERINANIHSRQRTTEDRYRDAISRERMNVNINSRQRSAEGRYQDKIIRDRININVHSRQRIAEDHHRDSITRERMNGNTNSRERTAKDRLRTDSTRERINANIHSRQRTAEDRYRDNTPRERMNDNINSRQRSAEGRYQDSITRDRININTHSKQRITEDNHRDSITRERIDGNIISRERTAKDRLRTDSTRERINSNIHSRQRTTEDRYRDDTSRERMNVNINSRQRSAEGRYQDSITRDRINANAHSRQRIAEDRYREDTSKERMNVNINSRQRYAEGRYQDSITRDRININSHSKQRIAENHQRNGITREKVNGNINSRKRIVREDLTRESINVNIHSTQYPNKNNDGRIGSNEIKIIENRSERKESHKLTRNRIASQTHNQIRDIRNSYQRKLMRNDRFQISSRRMQYFDKENQVVNYLPRSMNRRTDERQRNIAERSSSKSNEKIIEISQNQNRHMTVLREIDIRNSAKNTQNNVEQGERNSQRNTPEKRQTRLYEVNRKMEKMRNGQSRNRESNEKQRILTERNLSKSNERRTEKIQNRNRRKNTKNEEYIRDSAKNTQTNVEQRKRNMQEKRRIRTYEINRNTEKIRNRQSMNRESNDRQRILAERSSPKSGERRTENIQKQNRRMNILNEVETQDSIKDTQGNVEQRERNSQRNTPEKRRIRSYETNRNAENIRNRQITNRKSNERQRIFAEKSSSKFNERRLDNIQNRNRRIDVLREIDIRNSARNSRRNVELKERNSQRNTAEKRQIHSYENINMKKIRNRQNTNGESNESQPIFAEESSSESSERRMDNIQNQNKHIDVVRQIDIRSSARNTRRNVELNERNYQRNTLEKREIRSYEVNRNIEKVKNRQSINRESTERQHILAGRSSSKSSKRTMENIQNQNRRMAASMDSLSQSLRTSKFSLRARNYITVPRKFIRIQLLRNKENSKRIANSNIKREYNGDVRKNEEQIIKANGGENILPGDRNVRETSNVKVYILQSLKVNSLSVRNIKSRQRENRNNYRYTRQIILGKITEDEKIEHRYSHRISESTLQPILNKDFIGKVQKDSDELIKSYKLVRTRSGRRLQETHLTEPADERIGMMTNRNVRTQRSRRLQEKHFNELSKESIKMMTNIHTRTRTDKQLQDKHFTETSQERTRMITNKNARTQTGRQLQERHYTELSEERTNMMASRIVRTQRSRQLQDRHFTETSEERIRITTNKNSRTRIGRQFTEVSEERIRIMTNTNVRTLRSRQLQKRYAIELSEERIQIMTNRNVRTRTSRQLQERHFTEPSGKSIRMMTNRNARTRIIDAVFEGKIQDVERLSIQGARKSSERSIRVNNDRRIGDQSYGKNLIADERHFKFQLRMTYKNVRTRTTEKGFERKIQSRERSSVQIARKINERSATVISGLRIISKVIGDQSYCKNAVSDERHSKLQLRMNDKLSRQARSHGVRFLGRVDFGQESKERLILQKRQTRLHEISVYLKQKVSQTKKLLENIRENTEVTKRNRACFRGKPQRKSIEVLILTRQNTQPRVASKRNIRDLHNSDNLQMKSVAFGSQNSHLLRQRNGRGYRGRYLEQTAERRARIFSVNTITLHKATNNHKFFKPTNGAQISSVAIRESMYVEKLFGQKMSVFNTRKNIHNIFTRTIISESRSRLPRRITMSPRELNEPSSARVHSLRINLGSNRRLNNLRSRSDTLNNLNKLNQRIRENRYFDNQFRNVQFTRNLNARQKSANSYDDVRKRSLPSSRQNKQQISRNSLNEIRHSIPREEMRRTRTNILRVEIRDTSKQENYNLLSSNLAPENNKIQKFSALEVVPMPKTNIFEERKSSRIQGTQEGPSSTYTSDSQEYWKISGNNVSSFLVNLILGFLIILATSERNEIKTKPFKERLTDILFLRSSVF